MVIAYTFSCPAGRQVIAESLSNALMKAVICNEAALGKDFAFEPSFPTSQGNAAVNDAMARLDRLHVAVILHRPTCMWILHTQEPPQSVQSFDRQLQTITRHCRVKFGPLTPLDRFHGEALGLFQSGLPARPAYEGEPEPSAQADGRYPEPPVTVMDPQDAAALFEGQLASLNAGINDRAAKLVLRNYSHWNRAESSNLPMVSGPMREAAAQQLTRSEPPSEWCVFGGPVTELTFCRKPKMSAARQLAWTLFRLRRAGLAPSPEVARYIDFLMAFLGITQIKRRDNACTAARALWVEWTKRPFPDLPENVAMMERAVRTGREGAQCVVCLLPVPKGDAGAVCCNACEAFACQEHGCAKLMMPQQRCPDGVPGDVHRMRAVIANIEKLQRFSTDHATCKDYPTTRNTIAETARAEMRRDGCCQGTFCYKHLEVHRNLGAIDEQYRLFRAGGVRWSTVEEEMDRLSQMLRPIRRFARYACPQCEGFAVPGDGAASDRGNMAANVAAWDHSPAPLDGSLKRSFAEFMADPGRAASDRAAQWACLTPAERDLRWNPVPGSFMLVQPWQEED